MNISPATPAPRVSPPAPWLAPAHGAAAPVRVFVADDHSMFRLGVAEVLAGERTLKWVGEAGDGAEAVRAAPALAPDVVLMDLAMPRLDGIAALRALRPLLPQARFIVVACSLDATQARRALDAGAQGFLLKNTSAHDLLQAIHAAHRGQRVLTTEVMDALLAEPAAAPLGADLTRRERRLLALMARGLGNREIGAQMDITMPTVKFHVTHILSKLQVENRTAAVLAALRHGLVELD